VPQVSLGGALDEQHQHPAAELAVRLVLLLVGEQSALLEPPGLRGTQESLRWQHSTETTTDR